MMRRFLRYIAANIGMSFLLWKHTYKVIVFPVKKDDGEDVLMYCAELIKVHKSTSQRALYFRATNNR